MAEIIEPKQPNIIQFETAVMPGQMPGSFILQVIGLSTDSKIYFWDGKARKWSET